MTVHQLDLTRYCDGLPCRWEERVWLPQPEEFRSPLDLYDYLEERRKRAMERLDRPTLEEVQRDITACLDERRPRDMREEQGGAVRVSVGWESWMTRDLESFMLDGREAAAHWTHEPGCPTLLHGAECLCPRLYRLQEQLDEREALYRAQAQRKRDEAQRASKGRGW